MKIKSYFKSGLTLNNRGRSLMDELTFIADRDNLSKEAQKRKLSAIFGLKGKYLDRFAIEHICEWKHTLNSYVLFVARKYHLMD